MSTQWELVSYAVTEDVREKPTDPNAYQKAKHSICERVRTVEGGTYSPETSNTEDTITFYLGSIESEATPLSGKWYCVNDEATPAGKVGWYMQRQRWEAWGTWEDFTPPT